MSTTVLNDLIHEAEAARVLQICNACRYCEGFCAVFPAMTRRLSFPAADVHYLANLCHGCGACLHACQYAEPHAFRVNVPQALARVRAKTYADHAWPAPMAALYRRNGVTVAVALAAAFALFLLWAAARQGPLWQVPAGGSFYAVFPHGTMVAVFAPVFAFMLFALGIGVARFWRGQAPGAIGSAAIGEAAHDALRLKYLDGGHGEGCNEADDRWTHARRRFHHLTFYGFALCFASTCVATLYHYGFGWIAPYGWTSLPKLLGMPGGAMLAVGTAGLGWLRWRRDPRHAVPEQRAMDWGLVALLFLIAVSGLALPFLRAHPALPTVLCLHLGAVLAFFATAPYGKFAHGAYRAAALLKWAIEKRQPLSLRLGSD
jgi:citrate/tricarballylate utilization protein